MINAASKTTLIREVGIAHPTIAIPKHVAVIMDGNGRWAKRRSLPRFVGHQEGAKTLKEIIRCCKDWGIKILTVYAFSTENWNRPQGEIEFLMRLFKQLLVSELEEMQQEGVRIRFIGELNGLPDSLQAIANTAMLATQNNQAVILNVAINYGGRNEIVRACRQLAYDVKLGKIQPEEIEANLFEQYLDTCELSDPDLLIRTSGEMRLSNFLLWQLAYTEIYVTDTLWPDFKRVEFERAILAYQQRDRRFGKV